METTVSFGYWVQLSYIQTHLLLKPWVKRFPTSAINNPGFWKDVVILGDG